MSTTRDFVVQVVVLGKLVFDAINSIIPAMGRTYRSVRREVHRWQDMGRGSAKNARRKQQHSSR